MNGLLVVGGVVLGSMATQKAIVGAMHGKEIAKRQNWRECQEVLFENRKSADDVLDNLRWVSVEGAHTLFTARRNDDTVLIHDVDVVVGLGADASDKLLSKGLVDHGRHLPFCPLLYHSWAESTTDWVSGHVKRRLKGRLFT